MKDGLRVTYCSDDDWLGQLVVEVEHEGFAGISDCYFNRDELMQFAEQLGSYPLPDDPASLVGGYGQLETDEVSISISAKQVSPLGQVGIEIRLRNPSAGEPSAREVHLTMPTTYGRLDTFRREWLAVLGSDSAEPVMLGAERI